MASSSQATIRAGRCAITPQSPGLPIQIVFETAAVLKYAYLFETASEGILCREEVPGSTILYIRDSIKNKILYSRPIETPASDTAERMDDTSPTQVVAVTQGASASTDLAVIPEEPRPRPTTNLEFIAPSARTTAASASSTAGSAPRLAGSSAQQCAPYRANGKVARNEICVRSGIIQFVCGRHQRSQSSDISQRGLLSLDAEPTQTAKKQVKSALKLGYTSVLDRFTSDVSFAIYILSTERGLTRSAMLVQDAIATAVLPNPGRSSEQRTMGVGAQGSMQYGAGSTAASTARLLFLRAEPAALLKLASSHR